MTTMTLAKQAAAAKPSFVYIIGSDGSSLVKIGKANDVLRRFGSIQRMSPVELRLLAHFPGGYEREAALHQKFHHLRTYGEWFDFGELDPVAEVSAAVAELTAADAAKACAIAARAEAPGTVVEIRKKLWVMRGDGQFQCVASVQGKRRCRNNLAGFEVMRPKRLHILGAGFIEGYTISVRTKADEERVMMQLCSPHYDCLLEDRYYNPAQSQPTNPATRPMWEPFDIARHAELILLDILDRA